MDYIAAAVEQMDKATLMINLGSLSPEALDAIRKIVQKQEESQTAQYRHDEMQYM